MTKTTGIDYLAAKAFVGKSYYDYDEWQSLSKWLLYLLLSFLGLNQFALIEAVTGTVIESADCFTYFGFSKFLFLRSRYNAQFVLPAEIAKRLC